MKKFRVMAALTLALSLLFTTAAFAATSPSTATILTSAGQSVTVKEVTDVATLTNLSGTINAYLANFPGTVASVKVCKDIQKPAGYVDGTPITFSWAVAGLANGANVVIFHQKADGTVEAVFGVVQNGVVTFTLTSLSPVAIVELVSSSAVPAAGGLHQTGDVDYAGLSLILALLSGSVLIALRKSLKTE